MPGFVFHAIFSGVSNATVGGVWRKQRKRLETAKIWKKTYYCYLLLYLHKKILACRGLVFVPGQWSLFYFLPIFVANSYHILSVGGGGTFTHIVPCSCCNSAVRTSGVFDTVSNFRRMYFVSVAFWKYLFFVIVSTIRI